MFSFQMFHLLKKKKKEVKTEYQKAISCLPYTLVLERALKLWHALI